MRRLPVMARCGGVTLVLAAAWKIVTLSFGVGCGPVPGFVVLTGGQEVPPVETEGGGEATFSLNDDETELTFMIQGCCLSGPITAAHFHMAPFGQDGPVVFDLGAFVTEVDNNFTISGTTRLADWTIQNVVAELRAGNIYVNLHTAENPDGELRGQVNVR